MGRQNLLTRLWNKIIEPGITKALIGLISLLIFSGTMIFASLRSAPAQLKDHEKRIEDVEARVACHDSVITRHEYDIRGLAQQGNETNKKLDGVSTGLEQNRQLSEKILLILTQRRERQ
jgi:predicted  nucleic acid-binding Zn-ribbon protein